VFLGGLGFSGGGVGFLWVGVIGIFVNGVFFEEKKIFEKGRVVWRGVIFDVVVGR